MPQLRRYKRVLAFPILFRSVDRTLCNSTSVGEKDCSHQKPLDILAQSWRRIQTPLTRRHLGWEIIFLGEIEKMPKSMSVAGSPMQVSLTSNVEIPPAVFQPRPGLQAIKPADKLGGFAKFSCPFSRALFWTGSRRAGQEDTNFRRSPTLHPSTTLTAIALSNLNFGTDSSDFDDKLAPNPRDHCTRDASRRAVYGRGRRLNSFQLLPATAVADGASYACHCPGPIK